MATEIARRDNGLAERYGLDAAQFDLITRTVAKGADPNELELFLYTAKVRGLDPILKQIHAIKRWDKTANRETMAIQVGIDGLRLIADRTERYAGNDEPLFEGWVTEGDGADAFSHPEVGRVTVWKLVQGQRCPFTAAARWDEFYPGGRQGFMWRKMPRVMLGKTAEAAALRKAFPAETSGLYIHEEMQQADRGVTTGEVIQAAQIGRMASKANDPDTADWGRADELPPITEPPTLDDLIEADAERTIGPTTDGEQVARPSEREKKADQPKSDLLNEIAKRGKRNIEKEAKKAFESLRNGGEPIAPALGSDLRKALEKLGLVATEQRIRLVSAVFSMTPSELTVGHAHALIAWSNTEKAAQEASALVADARPA